MFGLFKSPSYRDPVLGELSRSRGHWRGSLTLEGGRSVPLVLSGGRSEPEAEALVLARQAVRAFASWRSVIETALFEHYRPYAEAVTAGELPSPSQTFPKIETPDGVWPHVTAMHVSVTPLDDALTLEVGYRTAWDEEHTLGARFQAGEFVELCGSVLPP